MKYFMPAFFALKTSITIFKKLVAAQNPDFICSVLTTNF